MTKKTIQELLPPLSSGDHGEPGPFDWLLDPLPKRFMIPATGLLIMGLDWLLFSEEDSDRCPDEPERSARTAAGRVHKVSASASRTRSVPAKRRLLHRVLLAGGGDQGPNPVQNARRRLRLHQRSRRLL